MTSIRFLYLLFFTLALPFLTSAQINRQWDKIVGGEEGEAIYQVIPAIDEGIMVLGVTESTDGDYAGNHGGRDGFLTKLDYDGNVIWQRIIGGSDVDNFQSMIAYDNQSYIIVGSTTSIDGDISDTTTTSTGGLASWVVKVDLEGQIIWDKKFIVGLGSTMRKVDKDEDGNIIIMGTSSNFLFLKKLDTQGEEIWQKVHFDSEAPYTSSDFLILENNKIILLFTIDVGSAEENFDFNLIEYNPEGEIVWEKLIGGSKNDWAEKIIASQDGNFLISGSTLSDDGDIGVNGGSTDIFIAELNETGVINWSQVISSNEQDVLETFRIIEDKIILSGNSQSTNGDLEIPYGFVDIFMAELTIDGDLNWVEYFGGTSSEYASDFYFTSDTSIIFSFSSSSDDFDMTGNHGGSDIFIAYLDYDFISAQKNPTFDHKLKLWPNPTNHTIHLEFPQNQNDRYQVIITNLIGEALFRTEIFSGQRQINLNALTAGIYFCELWQQGELLGTRKVIKQ